jgi:uncharacterized protein (DUF433 family)
VWPLQAIDGQQPLEVTKSNSSSPCTDVLSEPGFFRSNRWNFKTAADGLVVSNPGILSGTPVFRSTQLPVQTLFDHLADGLSFNYFLETFEGISREQAQAVLRYGWERIAAQLARSSSDAGAALANDRQDGERDAARPVPRAEEQQCGLNRMTANRCIPLARHLGL